MIRVVRSPWTNPSVGGQPWGYVFNPSGEASYDYGTQKAWRLAPRWFYVL